MDVLRVHIELVPKRKYPLDQGRSDDVPVRRNRLSLTWLATPQLDIVVLPSLKARQHEVTEQEQGSGSVPRVRRGRLPYPTRPRLSLHDGDYCGLVVVVVVVMLICC